MNARNVIIGAIAAACLALFLGVALHWQRALERGLPPRTVCVDRQAALVGAAILAADTGGAIISVLGTGSMAPFIPPAPAGADPLQTIVAFAVTDPRLKFEDVRTGTLVSYRASWYRDYPVLHQAAQLDGDGWIMTGLHNETYESRWRVTRENFIGTVAHVFTWPPPAAPDL